MTFDFRSDDGKVDELTMIEIQGDLVVNNNEGLANKFLSDLHYQKDVNKHFLPFNAETTFFLKSYSKISIN